MILRREETSELSTQVQRLVARLMDRDQNVEEAFDRLERRINRHRVAIDCEETRVRSHLLQVFPIANRLVPAGIPFGVGLHPADPDPCLKELSGCCGLDSRLGQRGFCDACGVHCEGSETCC